MALTFKKKLSIECKRNWQLDDRQLQLHENNYVIKRFGSIGNGTMATTRQFQLILFPIVLRRIISNDACTCKY